MKIRINTSIQHWIDNILLVVYSVMVFGYLGFFGRYRLLTVNLTGIILFIIFLFSKKRRMLSQISYGWIIFLGYIFINALIRNTRNGFEYVGMLFSCLMVLFIQQERGFDIRLYNLWRKISVIFALVTILNNFSHNIVIRFFGFMLTPTQVNTINNNIAFGDIPGLAGEASFNCFCIAIGFAIQMSRICLEEKKAMDIFLALILYIGIYLTGKRSALLLLPAIAVLIFVYIGIQEKGIYKKLLILIGIMALPLFIIAFSGVITSVLNKGGNSVDLSNREWFWAIARELHDMHPFFGNGINTYDFYYNRYKQASGYVYFAGAHNSYLQYAAELGNIGLLIFIFNLIYEIVKISKGIRICKQNNLPLNKLTTVFGSLFLQIYCIFYAMSENPFYQPQQIMTYFIAVSCATNFFRVVKEGKKSEYISGKLHGNKQVATRAQFN